MAIQDHIANTKFENQEEEKDFFSSLDFGKIWTIVKKSLIWVILIFLFSLTTAYFYLRYTRPIYESVSDLKLEVKNQASNLINVQGLNSFESDLFGEVEFIRSEIIYDAVLNASDLWVSYFAKGNILDTERYKSSPFKVKYKITNGVYYDFEFYIRILDKNEFELSYTIGDEEITAIYKFNEKISNPDFEFIITINPNYKSAVDDNIYYYFKVNSREKLLNFIKSNLKVTIINQAAKILNISFSDTEGTKARDIVNTIDSVYLRKTLEKKNQTNIQQLAYLDKKIKDIEVEIDEYESKIQKFVIDNKSKDISGKFEQSLGRIEELLIQKAELDLQLESFAEAEQSLYEDSVYSNFIGSSEIISPEINNYLTQLNELKKQRNNILYSKNENTSSVVLITQKITLLKKNILNLIIRNKKMIYEKVVKIQSEINNLEGGFMNLPSKEREYNKMQKSYAVIEGFYSNMLNRKAEIAIAEAGIVPEFVILAPANMPTIPIFPKKNYIYGIALAGATLLSILLIGLLYLSDTNIRTIQELEKLTSVTVLGGIPLYKNKVDKFSKLIVQNNPKSSVNEALRTIRTNLDFIFPMGKGLNNPKEKKIISVTSTISGEGKTFVAVNLAGIIAMSDLKVVILDCDMRKPKVHIAFDRLEDENEKGMSTILIKKHTYKECIRKTSIDTLDFISAGPTPPNPSELLLRESLLDLIEQLKQDYDVIILDTPPVGLVTDGILIMKFVDVPLYVFRSNYSKRIFTNNLNKLIKNDSFKNLAIIFNALKNEHRYSYYHQYYEEEKKEGNLLSRMITRIFKN